MQMKNIVFGLGGILLLCFVNKSAFAVPEPAIMLLLFTSAIAVFLLPFTYQMKNDMAKMQKIIDGLTADLKRNREEQEVNEEPLTSEQQDIKTDIEKMGWDELEQETKDAHIAQICQSPFNIDPSSASQTDSSQERFLPQF